MKPFFCELQAVNEAVNELLIEEEDFAALRESITTYDNFDQLSLAGRCVSFWTLERVPLSYDNVQWKQHLWSNAHQGAQEQSTACVTTGVS